MFKGKKGQVTIFIIFAIVIVVIGILAFAFRDNLRIEAIPSSIEPVQASFLNCIESDTLAGISILESKGGYIDNPDFVSGSRYMPFSSELDFFGIQIPYWYYVSGNNIEVNQVPSVSDMEESLNDYLKGKLLNCNFDEYIEGGYEISYDSLDVEVKIRDRNVQVDVRTDLSVSYGTDSFLMKDFSSEVNSLLGSLYADAVKVYELEQENLFLENYSVDVLYLYTPVTGVELSCSPMFWNVDEFYSNFSSALVANIDALKNDGRDDDYFALNFNVDSELNFLTFDSWPSTFEVANADSNILIAEPIGNQEGLGILGFCYVPYHFVYNVRYPVLVQVSSSGETFQFPTAVIIDKNMPRKGKVGVSAVDEVSEICEFRNNNLLVSLYDIDLNPVDGQVSYECFGSNCYIGSSSEGQLDGLFPQCVNGLVKVSSDGFKDTYVSTGIDEGEVVVIMDREYELELELYTEGKKYSDLAIINFISDDSSFSVAYPDNKKVVLSEDEYEIKVYFYENSSIKFEETTIETCTEVPRSGVGGYFGVTKEECFESVIPEQEISSVLTGGGSVEYYFIEKELRNSNKLILMGEGLNIPEDISELTQNYELVDGKSLEVSFE